MKKMMIMMVAASMLSAQAGFIEWGMGRNNATSHFFYGDTTGTFAAGTIVYLIMAADMSNVDAAIKAGTFGSLVVDTNTMGGSPLILPPKVTELTGIVGNTAIALVIFQGGGAYNSTVGSSGQYVLSTSKPGSAAAVAGDAVGSTINFTGNAGGGGFNVNEVSWKSYTVNNTPPGGDVPEPATALLALAGVGLLIRRKRR